MLVSSSMVLITLRIRRHIYLFFLLSLLRLGYLTDIFVPDGIKSELYNLCRIINLLKCNQLVTTVSKLVLHPLQFIHKYLT